MREHGPPPDVSSEAWNEWATEVLEDTGFDPELGAELSRDAQRVSRGDLSADEFHDRYHDDLVDEFGVDDRPTDPDVTVGVGSDGSRSNGGFDPTDVDAGSTPVAGDADGRMPGVPEASEDTSRRSVLKLAGAAGVAAVGGSTLLQAAGAGSAVAQDADPDTQMGMVIDTERCIACLQCMEGCHEENNTADGALWSYVFRYEQDDYTDQEHYLSRPCQHCSDAPCINACPTASRYKRTEDGIVLTDYDRCTGCRYCEVSCPYGVNYLQWADSDGEFEYDREVDGRTAAGDPPQGVMGKCTFCIHRQDSDDEELQGTTRCEDECPVDAIHFGDLEDPESAPRQHLEEKADASKFRLFKDANTSPNVFYIGNEPEGQPEPVDGPNTPEDMGLQMDRPGRSVQADGGENDGD